MYIHLTKKETTDEVKRLKQPLGNESNKEKYLNKNNQKGNILTKLWCVIVQMLFLVFGIQLTNSETKFCVNSIPH